MMRQTFMSLSQATYVALVLAPVVDSAHQSTFAIDVLAIFGFLPYIFTYPQDVGAIFTPSFAQRRFGFSRP